MNPKNIPTLSDLHSAQQRSRTCAHLSTEKVQEMNQRLYPILGAVFEVHKTLGRGLEEPIYNEALSMELTTAGIPNESERELPCYYKGRRMKKTYRMDMVCYEDIILEFKSVEQLIPAHREQLFNYMRLTKMPIGVLINFNAPKIIPEKYYFDGATNEVIRFY